MHEQMHTADGSGKEGDRASMKGDWNLFFFVVAVASVGSVAF